MPSQRRALLLAIGSLALYRMTPPVLAAPSPSFGYAALKAYAAKGAGELERDFSVEYSVTKGRQWEASVRTTFRGKGRRLGQSARSRAALEPGDTLTTGLNSYALIRFIDKTEITLRPETVFKLNTSAENMPKRR
jgi:hypothetical protein